MIMPTFERVRKNSSSSSMAIKVRECSVHHTDVLIWRDQHVISVMNGNIPAPLIAIDEDDEFFLTLSNVGMIMRPDLFEQHTVHFHGYPTLPRSMTCADASVAITSRQLHLLLPRADAGTYFWHCTSLRRSTYRWHGRATVCTPEAESL